MHRPPSARRRRARRSSLDRYLGADERPELITRQHPIALVGSALGPLGLIAPLLLTAWGVGGVESLRGDVGTWLLRAIFLLMVLLVLRLVWHVLAWELERVVITDEKVIHLEGVLQRRIASTPLAKVSEFTVRQPLLGRLLDFGSLVVDVPGGRDQALHGLAFLPDPAGMYRLVSDLARHGRVQEGGGSMQVPGAEDSDEPTAGGEPARAHSPWQPLLDSVDSDHTIVIPRAQPGGPPPAADR